MFLKQLHGHENIISVSDIFRADNNMDIYIVCDFMESDLHVVIKAKILEDVHTQFILYQILKALKYMHSGSLIHRDLKPSNILLNSDCHVKLCDFGLARSVSSQTGSTTTKGDPVMTDYVATRWYRAPELLLGSTTYTKGVDIWAVGCILAEALSGQPVFPGSSTLDQLEKVLAVTGRPTVQDVASIKSPYSNQMLDSCNPERKVPLSELFPKASAEALDFLNRCFQFNPDKRASAAELLGHPYIANFRDVKKEIDSPGVIDIPLNDNIRLTRQEYRDKLYQEIARMRGPNAELRSTTVHRPVSREASNPPIGDTVVKFEESSNTVVTQSNSGTRAASTTVPATKNRLAQKEHSYRSLTPTTCHTVMNSASKSIPPVSPAASSKSTLRTPSSGTNSRLKSPSMSNLVRSPSVKTLTTTHSKRQTTPVPQQRPQTPLRATSTVARGIRIGGTTPHRSMTYGLSITSGAGATTTKTGPVQVKSGTPPGKTTPPRTTTPPGKTPVIMGNRPSSGNASRFTKSSSMASGFMGLFGRSATTSTSSLLRSRPTTGQKR